MYVGRTLARSLAFVQSLTHTVARWLQSDKQAIRQKMLNHVAEKMKKLEEEKNAMSLSGASSLMLGRAP
mgnify:CR=1 FL=1